MPTRRNTSGANALAMVKRYKRLYSGLVYDVLDSLHLPNQVLSHDIRPLSRGMKVAGPALTLQSIDAPPGSVKGPGAYFSALCKACTPGCVAVYAMGREQWAGHWGELTSNSVHAHGCQGVVIDGGARDSDLLESMGFQVFCRYTSPIEMAKRAHFIGCQEPVELAGSLTALVVVRPGDWIFGDGDGVTVIPKDLTVEVLAKAEERHVKEAKGRKLFAAGVDPATVIRKYGVG